MHPTVRDVNLKLFHVAVSYSSVLGCLSAKKKKKKAIAQAVTSWNEWLTYKGVTLYSIGRISKTKIHQGTDHTRWASDR